MEHHKRRFVGMLCTVNLFLLQHWSIAANLTRAPYSWRNVAIGGGGYVLDVVCSPLKRNVVYLRTDVGGFYRWRARTSSWVPITDCFPASKSNYYGGEAIAVDPFNADTVYIAAGKEMGNALLGSIFKSRDGGRHWKQLPLNLPMGGNGDDRWAGPRLALSPFIHGLLLFGSRDNGLWRSSDGGHHWNVVCTKDTRARAGFGFNSVVFSAQNPTEAYASEPGCGVFVSHDGGTTWLRLPHSPAHVERLAASSTGSIYASATNGVYLLRHSAWHNITPMGNKGRYCGIAVNPRHSHEVLVATQSTRAHLYQSTDGGRTWSVVHVRVESSVPWYSQSMLQLQQVAGLTYDPVVAGRVWLTDWYAAYRCDDFRRRPALFVSHERGHEEVVVFTLAAPPAGPLLLSGVADVDGFAHKSLTRFPTHGYGSWYHGYGPTFGDTDQVTWCAGKPLNLARVGVMRWNNTGGGAYSSDGGQSWTAFTGLAAGCMPERIAISAGRPQSMAVLTLHDGPGYASLDGGKIWTRMQGLPAHIVPGVWYWNVPMAADGRRPGVFYICAGGSLYRSIDGGLKWNVRFKEVPNGFTALVATPGIAGDLWMACANKGLWHSIDGGRTFHKIAAVNTANLLSEGIGAGGRGVALFVVGTVRSGKHGIFLSTDYGASWKEIDTPNQPIGDVPECIAGSWRKFGEVFIGTNGRGVFVGKPEAHKLPPVHKELDR